MSHMKRKTNERHSVKQNSFRISQLENISIAELLKNLKKRNEHLKYQKMRPESEDVLKKIQMLEDRFLPTEFLVCGDDKNLLAVGEQKSQKVKAYELNELQSILQYNEPIQLLISSERMRLPTIEKYNHKMSAEKILNILYPPKCWKDKNGLHWMQTISTERSERDDIKKLNQQLQLYLELTGARKYGLCLKRPVIHIEFLSELIRKVMIDSPITGLLMFRLRDEQRFTNFVNESLLKLSSNFGNAIASEIDRDVNFQKILIQIKKLEKKLIKSEKRVKAAKMLYEKNYRRKMELTEIYERKELEKVEFVKEIEKQLVRQTDSIFLSKKKKIGCFQKD